MDYLPLALKHIDAVDSDVLAHGMGVGGDSYVVVLDLGIKGGPKYRVPLSELKKSPKPPKVEVDTEEDDEPADTEDEADDLSVSTLEALRYRELQAVAKEYGIAANQTADALIEALTDPALLEDDDE